MHFQKNLKESNRRKPNKIWVDKESKFYNNVFKKWLKDNDIQMYSTHNEGKSVYTDKLDDILNECNNTYHTPTNMKPVDVKDNPYIDFNKEVNDKYPKFKVGDHVRISKYKNIYAKGYTPN